MALRSNLFDFGAKTIGGRFQRSKFACPDARYRSQPIGERTVMKAVPALLAEYEVLWYDKHNKARMCF